MKYFTKAFVYYLLQIECIQQLKKLVEWRNGCERFCFLGEVSSLQSHERLKMVRNWN